MAVQMAEEAEATGTPSRLSEWEAKGSRGGQTGAIIVSMNSSFRRMLLVLVNFNY